MKNIIIVFFFVLFCHSLTLTSQQVDTYSQPLKERIFLNYNSSLFLTQENLLYKVYCIRDRNNRFSNLSKVAYVELVDKNKNRLLKQKLILNNGVGNGSFFIPKTTPSGNYKLIAYTQWMRNEGADYFFQGDITIVNTFIQNQNITLTNSDTIHRAGAETGETDKKLIIDRNNFLILKLDKKAYSKRDKVEFRVKSIDEQKSFGSYSISVRKINSIKNSNKYTPENYVSLYHEKSSQNKRLKKKAEFLLEYEGDLLTGNVRIKDTGKPAADVVVLIASPTGKYPLRFATTNSLGEFKFIFKEIRQEPSMVIQVRDKNRKDYSLSLNTNKSLDLDYSSFKFDDFKLSENTKNRLLSYSIQNQIENVYAPERQNILNTRNIKSSNLRTNEIYFLDDYKRFSTVRETFTEIIKYVRVIKKKKKYKFRVENIDYYDEDKYLPFIFVDGVLIQDQNKFANYDAKKIKKISVLREKFTYKSIVFIGIITIETFEGNFNANELNTDYIKRVELDNTIDKKVNYNANYTTNKLEKIPDYRRQLYWDPDVNFNRKERKFTFYTSDISGDYEICIEGFNQQGQAVFLKEIFRVN